MPDEVLLQELDRGVLTLTFNRPERNNGWTMELEEAYFDALAAAAADAEVRAIVVTGAGRAFCPGLDVQALSAATDGTRFGDPSPSPDDVRPVHPQAGDRRDQRRLRRHRVHPGGVRRPALRRATGPS